MSPQRYFDFWISNEQPDGRRLYGWAYRDDALGVHAEGRPRPQRKDAVTDARAFRTGVCETPDIPPDPEFRE